MVSYESNGKKFNFRVSGIIYDKNHTQILIHQIKGYDFWLLPGGRVELLENTRDAIERELKEELGIDFEAQNLFSVNENFFNLFNKKYHEIGFFFIVKPRANDYKKFELMCKRSEFTGVEGEKYIFKWAKLNDLKDIDFRPHCVVNKIINNDSKVCNHYTVDEL